MKGPRVNRKKARDGNNETAVLGFCPYCHILSPSLTSVKGLFRTKYTISCICRESAGKQITGTNKQKIIEKWRSKDVD